MGKLERKNLKVFAENAPLGEMGQFGSAKATTKLNTKDIETIQELEAWQKGWQNAVISNKNYPPLEEMNGVINVLSYQIAYTLQEGLPEWNSKTTYYKGSIVKSLSGDTVVWYQSIIDENLNRALSDSTAWKGITPANTDLSNLSEEGQSKFSAKADINTPSIQAPYLKTTYVNGTSGYNIWSNGYCEQWGYFAVTSTQTTINLLKTYRDGNFNITAIQRSAGNPYLVTVYNTTPPTGNKIVFYCYTAGTNHSCYFKTSGYLAEGEY